MAGEYQSSLPMHSLGDEVFIHWVRGHSPYLESELVSKFISEPKIDAAPSDIPALELQGLNPKMLLVYFWKPRLPGFFGHRI